MLEEAIVDAQALREAAIQSAEQAVLARYSGQIKDTVESLLEQDEQQGQTYGGTPAAPKDADDKSIVEAQLDEYEGKAYAFGDLSDSNNFELEQEEEIEIDLEKIVAESNSVVEVEESDLVELVEENTEVELNEDDIVNAITDIMDELVAEDEVIAEKIKLDFEAQPRGWMARPKSELDEEAMLDLLAQSIAEMEMELTKEHKEVVSGLNTQIETLNETIEQKNNENVRLEKEVDDLYEAVDSLKMKFDEMTLVNAKLLYTNKVLNDTAYNSRQKNEIVESIQTADSVEKAKIVYETLQSAVGTRKSSPKSLSEAVDRRTSTSMLLKSDNAQKKESDNLQESLATRLKLLAGIDN
tara:strand:+ start:4127 stop:5191 length:1065 start_codon:yes stop_codon:yes gene_type:complete